MNSRISVELRILDERIRQWGIPRYHSEMAAGLDLLACLDAPLRLEPQAPAVLVSSGVAIHIDDPHVAAVVVPRSGLGHKAGLVMGNLVGVIDADYTGPLMVSCWNRSAAGTGAVVINPGDRIAQLLFLPILRPELTVVAEFSNSSTRAASGFGSTGYAQAAQPNASCSATE
jgi:dUTP pyrophosphatase